MAQWEAEGVGSSWGNLWRTPPDNSAGDIGVPLGATLLILALDCVGFAALALAIDAARFKARRGGGGRAERRRRRPRRPSRETTRLRPAASSPILCGWCIPRARTARPRRWRFAVYEFGVSEGRDHGAAGAQRRGQVQRHRAFGGVRRAPTLRPRHHRRPRRRSRARAARAGISPPARRVVGRPHRAGPPGPAGCDPRGFWGAKALEAERNALLRRRAPREEAHARGAR